MSDTICPAVQRVHRTSKYYLMGILKSSICLVVPRTSTILFAERTFGGAHVYIRAKNSGVGPPKRISV